MAFNLYFAGSDNKCNNYIKENDGLRLYSYLNERKHLEKWSDDGSKTLFVDSGAFSVAHSGKEVDIDTYIDYINNNENRAVIWAALDIIPYPILNVETANESCDKSWNNYLYMINKLNNPHCVAPVFHFGEPLSGLKRILEFRHKDGKSINYIGIGGRHGVSTSKQIEYFETVFDVVKESSNPNVKIHAFGITVKRILEQFPFESADSTSHLKVAIYGGIMLGFSGKIIPVSERRKGEPNSYFNMTKIQKKKLEKYVEDRGFTVKQLSESDVARIKFNICECIKWAKGYKLAQNKTKLKKLF